MAFRVVDADYAYKRALSLGAKPAETSAGPNELAIPAIEGTGGLHIYLVDRYGAKGSIYDVDFEWIGEPGREPSERASRAGGPCRSYSRARYSSPRRAWGCGRRPSPCRPTSSSG